jgi:3-methyladenine DNA glycosylase AlkC
MSYQLKDQFGPSAPRAIARMIHAVYPDFPQKAFLRDALAGYGPLSLTERGRQVAEALHRHLPQDFGRAVDILLGSSDQPHGHRATRGMAGFLYLPHLIFVARHGLEHFEHAMRAQYALTQRFTAEFSIRPFLEKHPRRTLARLREWASDPNVHVRPLVSEGTRPRLPWAPRLRELQRDPTPVLELLERLKDDPELYVRRSVANHLNDIGKDHPALLARIARRWLRDATSERRWIVRHALRSAIKRGEPWALRVLGFGGPAQVQVRRFRAHPPAPRIGGEVELSFRIENRLARTQHVLVDLVVHFVKARGATAKIFKLRTIRLAPGVGMLLGKKISLAQLTTRRHYPGVHRVEAMLNGRRVPLGEFRLRR